MLSKTSAADDFKNIVTKREIVHNGQVFLLPQCFQLGSIILLSFMEMFHIFATMFSKLHAVDLLYVGKGLLWDWCQSSNT